ncbi:hypothetical protein [Micromonospora luteifusca]|uniref:hypothetical protein n=1 Tax=Micromonospora luteifusca TaxID=709860 RepID=UPI0033A0FC87
MTTEAYELATDVIGVRLHTRGPVTLPWLARSVVPVARALHGDGNAVVHLRRGWRHGPHVDVVAYGGAGGTADWATVAAELDAGPLDPARALSEEDYLTQAREFGRLEAVPPPYLPMAEHGAVQLLRREDTGPRQPALRALPGWEVAQSVLTTPLLDMVDELARRPEQGTVRLGEAFAALADSYFLGLAHGVYSFRSHVEAFLAWARPTRDVRPVFAQRLARDAAVLRPVVEQRLAGTPSGPAAAWRTAFAYCAGTFDATVTDGTLSLDLLDEITGSVDTAAMGPPSAPDVVPTGDQPDTEFHRRVAASGAYDRTTQWFAAYRVLINLFYQQLPLLTVSPMQRYYMCYAISELVDEVLGESWQDRLTRDRVRVVAAAGRAA